MTLDLLSDPGGLEAEWWDLWRADPVATPFQSPAWLIPWQRAFGSSADRILVLRRDGRAILILPVFFHDGKFLLWGAGTSDYLNAVCDPSIREEELRQVLETLDRPLDLFQLPPESPLLRVGMREGAGTATRSEACFVVPLPLQLGRGMRQNLAYYRRRAEREEIGAAGPAGPEALADLVELHTRRWRRRGEAGVLSDPRVLAWHRDAVPLLHEAGLLRMSSLQRRGETVGVLYGLCARQRRYHYIAGFDPDLQHLGLGTILVGDAIAAAEAEGCEAFDFLRGPEPYKVRWGATERPTTARQFAPVPVHA